MVNLNVSTISVEINMRFQIKRTTQLKHRTMYASRESFSIYSYTALMDIFSVGYELKTQRHVNRSTIGARQKNC